VCVSVCGCVCVRVCVCLYVCVRSVAVTTVLRAALLNWGVTLVNDKERRCALARPGMAAGNGVVVAAALINTLTQRHR